MKRLVILCFLFCGIVTSCNAQEENRYLFFLHNRFLETHGLDEAHPVHGIVEYQEIIAHFEDQGLQVIHEKRKGNVDAREYASKVVLQIDSLIKHNISPSHITVVGTSKGGYIAQYVSTIANNPNLNFVFIASFNHQDIQNFPEINYCGNILSIHEKSDTNMGSALARKESSSCKIAQWKEIQTDTGLGHGFLFKAMDDWLLPTVRWAKGDYILPHK